MQSLTSGLGNQHAAINASMASSVEEFSTQKLKRQYVRRSKQYRIFKLHPWTTLLVAVTLGFVILIAAGYVFNWSWTGFSGDKLWDWLELLVLPGVLTSLSIWFAVDQRLAGNKKEQRRWGALWIILITVALLALIVLIIGGYAFNWDWTGFSDNKLSDWLRLLLVPFVLPLVSVWFTNHPIKLSRSVSLEDENIQEAQPHEKASE